jgi:hypothetical protein
MQMYCSGRTSVIHDVDGQILDISRVHAGCIRVGGRHPEVQLNASLWEHGNWK